MTAGAESCAVLFGIPVDREAFDFAARQGSDSDYVKGMLCGRDPALVWTIYYEPVANAGQQLAKTALELGAGVYQRATLRDFASATTRFPTVILLAHWRGAMFRVRDFLVESTKIFERLDQSPALRRVKPKGHDAEALVDALNEAIEDRSLLDALPRPLSEAGARSRTVGQTICRDLIDEALSGVATPGNRVELFDGLHTPAQIEGALWSKFSGTLDLALCNSEALATFLDLRRHNAVRHLYWPVVVHPLPQLLKVETTLQLMAACGADYIETRLSLEEAE